MLRTALITVAGILTMATPSVAAALPGGYTCSELKDTVASYGASVVLAAARQRGISEHQIKRIRHQCKV